MRFRILLFVLLLGIGALGAMIGYRLFPSDVIHTPGPLRVLIPGHNASTLDATKIIAATNARRADAGFPALQAQSQLSAAATAKVQDMFTKQYFDHIGPTGTEPRFWSEQQHYVFMTIGENLALGNFADEEELVTAWMNSPGHRANILSPDFTEIGVASQQGLFEGKSVWISVQEFGTPASICPTPSETLRHQYDEKRAQEETMAATLKKRQQAFRSQEQTISDLFAKGNALIEQGNAAIERGNNASSRSEAEHSWEEGKTLQEEGKKVLAQAKTMLELLQKNQQTYNADVATFNQLQATITSLSESLNTQITTFNRCTQQYQ